MRGSCIGTRQDTQTSPLNNSYDGRGAGLEACQNAVRHEIFPEVNVGEGSDSGSSITISNGPHTSVSTPKQCSAWILHRIWPRTFVCALPVILPRYR